MAREKHKDFYGRLEQSEKPCHKALEEEQSTLPALFAAGLGGKKDELLSKYRRAVNRVHRARERRRRFLDKYRP